MKRKIQTLAPAVVFALLLALMPCRPAAREVEPQPAADIHIHPNLILTQGDIDRIESNVKNVAWAREYFKFMKSGVDPWLKLEPDIPDQGGGYTENYICPAHGKELIFDRNNPHRHYCPPGDKYYEGEELDAAWITMAHFQNIMLARDAGLLYLLTGDGAYAIWAQKMLTGYARKYPKYRIHGGPAGMGRIGAQSLDEAKWLIFACETFDFIADSPSLTQEDRDLIIKGLLMPAAKHVEMFPFGIHNIQLWHSVSMLMAGLLADDKGMVDKSLDVMRQEIDKGITPEGMWREITVNYQLFAMRPLAKLAALCKTHGFDLCEAPGFKKYFAALEQIVMPDGGLPAVNDGVRGWRLTDSLRGLAAARWAFDDPGYDAIIQTFGGQVKWKVPDANVFYYYIKPQSPPAAWTPPRASSHLPGSGLTVLRRGGLYALTKYNAFGGAHDHNDRLELVFFSGGRELFPDLGTVSYGHPLYKAWYQKTEAHNTIMVDSKQQNPSRCEPLNFYDEPEFTGVSVRCDDIYPGVSVTRFLALTDQGLADVMTAESDSEHVYDWLLRAVAKVWEIDPQAQAPTPNLEIVLESPRELKDKEAFVWNTENGARDWVTTLFPAGKSEVCRGAATGFYPTEKMPLLMWRQKGKTAVFAAVTAPPGVESNASAVEDGISIEINSLPLAINFVSGEIRVAD